MALVSGVGGGTGGSATKSAYQAAAKKAAQKSTPKPAAKAPAKTATKAPTTSKPKTTTTPVVPNTPAPIEQVAPVAAPVETNPAANWTLEGDPIYQMGLAGGQSAFNYARNTALADLQGQESAAAQERKSLDVSAAEARRRLAGNYAARGMAGGAAGALSQAEARANAQQIAARTSIQDKIAALNQQFLSNYGAVGSDWTGTLAGQQYKADAAQQAISAQLARYGSI